MVLNFAFYNIVGFFWFLFTVAAGLKAADGKTGPLTWWGTFFDNLFDLGNCEKVPVANQSPPYLRPAIGCPTPYTFPHGGNASNTINPLPFIPAHTTVVNGVGGVGQSSIRQRQGKAIDPATYIMQVMTGNPVGNVANGEYDKKRFKFGTPYMDQQPSFAGYYQSNDNLGRSVPLIAPSTTASNKAFVPTGFDYTTNPAWVTTETDRGNKVQSSYNGITVRTGNMTGDVLTTYTQANAKLFVNKPGVGFSGPSYQISKGNYGNESNTQFIRTSLLNPDHLTWVPSSQAAANTAKAHPARWSGRRASVVQ